MIRGTNRFAVEISSTGSPYFERAICFVRPQFSECSRLSLHRAAREMIRGFDGRVEPLSPGDDEEPTRMQRLISLVPVWALIVVPALAGAVISLIVCLLFLR